MKYRIKKIDDTDAMREIHKLAFSGDRWPGDDHEFWVAFDEHGAIAGFAAAVLLTAECVFLSRSAVTVQAKGSGLHRKMIDVRMKWARSERARLVVTHVSQYNYPSMINLLRAGFKFAEREHCPRGYDKFHMLWVELDVWPGTLKGHFASMLENP